jgi:hypothetical protein
MKARSKSLGSRTCFLLRSRPPFLFIATTAAIKRTYIRCRLCIKAGERRGNSSAHFGRCRTNRLLQQRTAEAARARLRSWASNGWRSPRCRPTKYACVASRRPSIIRTLRSAPAMPGAVPSVTHRPSLAAASVPLNSTSPSKTARQGADILLLLAFQDFAAAQGGRVSCAGRSTRSVVASTGQIAAAAPTRSTASRAASRACARGGNRLIVLQP